MAKIFRLRDIPTARLRERKARLLSRLLVPIDLLRGSCVEQYLTCGKRNCRCRQGRKHGPFQYLVQCIHTDHTRKFLLKTAGQRDQARAAVVAYALFQEKMEELSQINGELLRRGENLRE